jgi:hypothetical protein
VTLADERLKELDNPSLTDTERILIRCRVAAELTHRGQYEAAREALGELWSGIGQRPPVGKLSPAIDAEVMLRCGTLTRLLGTARNIAGAQEQAKDMLSEAGVRRSGDAREGIRDAIRTRYVLLVVRPA